MTGSVELPQELLEEVVDHLHDHQTALLNCSVASRRLAPVCRLHLFSEITLEYSRLCKLLELLDAPWSSLANTISKLVVTGPRQVPRGKVAPLIKSDYIPRDNSHLRERLAGVTSVRFTNLCPGDIPVSFWRLMEEMKGITAIEAHRVAFRCPNNFFGYISSLPVLKTLSITRPLITQDLRWEEEFGQHCITNRPPGNVVHVPLLDLRRMSDLPTHRSMGVKAGQAVLGWLLSQNPMPAVHSLRLNLDNSEPMSAMLQQYFDENGATIRNVWLTLPSDLNIMTRMPMLDFSRLNELQHLHVEGLLMSHETNSTTLEYFFCRLFTELFSSFTQTPNFDKRKPKREPPLRRISLSLTLDAKGADSFFGIPEYAVLQPFSWWCLPDIIENALEPFSGVYNHLEVVLTVKSAMEDKLWVVTEECVRAGVWKRVGQHAALRVILLPINGVDGDEDGV